MANIINAEHNAQATMVITLASLADASSRQSTIVNNTDDAQMIRVYFKVTTGTTPVDNRTIEFYLLTGDKITIPDIITDGAVQTDASITIESASLVNIVSTDNVANKTYQDSFLIRNPGVSWGIAVKNNSGFALNSTASNQKITYVRENQEVQ